METKSPCWKFPISSIRDLGSGVWGLVLIRVWFPRRLPAACRLLRILRASYDFSSVEVALQGKQQARAVAAVPTEEGLYFASDTPLEQNSIYRLERGGTLSCLAPVSSSSIYGCRVRSRAQVRTLGSLRDFLPVDDRSRRRCAERRGSELRALSLWEWTET